MDLQNSHDDIGVQTVCKGHFGLIQIIEPAKIYRFTEKEIAAHLQLHYAKLCALRQY